MIRALETSAHGPPARRRGGRTLYKTLDARHVFPNVWMPLDSVCRIRIYETVHPEEGRPTVVVASQIPGCAASVTNFAEDIATEVIRMQRARRGLGPGDPRHEFVWVEHYPPGILGLIPRGCFRLVSFHQMLDGSLACPKWDQPISQKEIEASLLGCPLGE